MVKFLTSVSLQKTGLRRRRCWSRNRDTSPLSRHDYLEEKRRETSEENLSGHENSLSLSLSLIKFE